MPEADNNWQQLVDNLPDLVARFDPSFRYLFVNREWSSETGIAADECLGKSFREIGLPAETCEILEANCRQVLSDRRAAEFEHTFTGSRGTRHFTSRLIPEFNDAGEVKSLLAVSRDMTQRVQAESALAASENRFRAFMDYSPGLFWIKDEAGRYIYMSRGCEVRHDIRFADCRNKTDYELWPYAIAKVYRDNDLLVLSDGRTQEVVETFEKSDGTTIHLLCYKFLIHDGLGCKYVGGSAVEITERVQVEQFLQERDLCLRALLETGAFVVLGMTTDCRLFEWNAAAERIYGFRREEVLGKDYVNQFLPEEVRRGVATEIQSLLAGRPTEGYVNDVLHRDGTHRTLLWNACRLVDPQAQVRGLVAVGQDITDWLRADAALRDSELRYRRLLNNLHDVVWSVEVTSDAFQGGMTFISEQAEEMFGYSKAEFLEDSQIWFRSLHPDDLPAVQTSMRRLEEGASHCHRSYRVQHGKTRQWRWIEDHVAAEHDREGKLTGLFGVARDVTDRVKAEAALRENELRLELALNASHAATWSWDAVQNVATWDRRYQELYEIDPELCPSFELWIERVHPEDRSRILTRVSELIAPGGGEIWHEEFRTVPLSQGIRWMEGIGRVERDAAGRALRFSGLNLDITDRKRAETAVRQSASEMQALVAAFPDLYLWLDADGTVRRFHAGIRPDDPPEHDLHRQLTDVFPPPVGDRLAGALQEAVSSRAIQEVVYSHQSDGAIRWFDARLVPISDSRSVLAVIRDVTARHRAEEEGRKLQARLQHAQKLESLGILAGGIAHDFNNILTAMMGYTDLALAELPAGSSVRSHLEHVMTSARRASELTQHMLAYSGRGQFVIEPVNLSEIIQELGALLQVSISKKAELRYRLDPQLPLVLADAGQLRQIIMNLLINASDALGNETGVISLVTEVRWWSQLELSSTYLDERLPEGRYVTLEVSDTGSGMDETTRARIFDPFFSTKSAGRGLGLGAVLGIIRGHHGAIQVLSEPGQGTTFRVVLPIAPHSTQLPAAESTTSPEQLAQGLVLVVDDEYPVRKLAQAMLERSGFQVVTAPDGFTALQVYQQHGDQIVLVILDLTMPIMSGEETLRELRQQNPHIRVILSSGYNESSATGEFSAPELTGFLQKPYRYRDLQDAVRNALA